MNMRLSVERWGAFFDKPHLELAEHLRAKSKTILEYNADHSGKTAALKMGQELDVYKYLCPKDGGLDLRALVLVREALGFLSPLADGIFAVQGLGTYPISQFGNQSQRDALDDFRTGKKIAGFALTEPNAGSDVASMTTHYTKSEGGYRLNGEKVFISNATIADQFVVFATQEPGAGKKGISAFCVAKDAPGLTIEETALGIEHPVGKLFFKDCKVPSSALLGNPGEGYNIAMATLSKFRVTVGAAAVGMAERAFVEARAHVCTREQFGKPLSSQQLVKGYLAEMATLIEASRGLVLNAAKAADDGQEDITLAAAKAKLFSTESAQKVIDMGVQLFGGLGVTKGNPVEELYRAIRPLRIYEGTSEIQKLIIGSQVVKEWRAM